MGRVFSLLALILLFFSVAPDSVYSAEHSLQVSQTADEEFRPLLFRLSCYDPELQDTVYVYKKVEGLRAFPLTKLNQILFLGNLGIDTKLSKIYAPFAGTPRGKTESFRVCKIVPIALLTATPGSDVKGVLGDGTAYEGLKAEEQADLEEDLNRLGSLTPEMQAAQIQALETVYETELKARVFPELKNTR